MLRKLLLVSVASLAMVAIIPSASHAQYTVYSSVAGPYASFAAATGVIGFDDYTAAVAGPTLLVSSFQFVGGVTTAGSTLSFTFSDSSGNVIATQNSTFATAGNFLYTITPGTQFFIPASGRLSISALNGATAQWYLTQTAPSIGSNSTSFGEGPSTGNPSYYQAFGISAVGSDAGTATLALTGVLPLVGAVCYRRKSRKS